MNRPKGPKRRRARSTGDRTGVSLIELLVVISTLSVVMTTSTITLFRLLQAQTAGTNVLADALTTNRLARDLRRDAHAATTAELQATDDGQSLVLTGGDGSLVTYRMQSGRMSREATVDPDVPVREEYALGGATAELELTESGRLITVRLRPTETPQTTAAGQDHPLQHRPSAVLTIQAALPAPRVAATANDDSADRPQS